MNDENIVRKIIESYYDPKGLDYSLGRINMGGCDFSVRKYTYADTEGDVELETFALQDEDNLHKVSTNSSLIMWFPLIWFPLTWFPLEVLHPRRGAQCVNFRGNSAAPMY